MLPSTGYFKSINCPFYESGCCDRPYCHFKHLRRDEAASIALLASQTQQAESARKVVAASALATASDVASDDKTELHQLVNEAVKKLLETEAGGDAETMTDKIVARVVEQLKPTIAPKMVQTSVGAVPVVANNTIGKHARVPSCVTKAAPCVYNPTPIAELKKRHIPVYMPTRESKVAAKRKSSTDMAKPWPSMLRESTNSRAAELTYKPTAIASNAQDADTVTKSYVPTVRSDAESPSNSYDDGNSNDYVPKAKEAYYPRSKKRREEYVPKKVAAPLKSVQQETNQDEILTCGEIHEPKFSEDEDVVDAATSTKQVQGGMLEQGESDGKENESNAKLQGNVESVDEKLSNKTSGKEEEKTTSKEHRQETDKKKDGRDSRKDTEHRSREKSGRSDCKVKSSSRIDKHHKNSHSSDSKKKSSSSSSSGSKDLSKCCDKEQVPSSKSDDGKSSRRRSSKSSSSRSSRSSRSSHSSRSRSDKKSDSRRKSSEKKQDDSSSSWHKSEKKSSNRNESSSERSLAETEEVAAFESNFIDQELMETSDSDHDVEEECLKIFQEYEPADHPKGVTIKEATKLQVDDDDVGRKRVAHPSAAASIVRAHGPSQPVKKLRNPQQLMYDRWRKMKEAAAAAAAVSSKLEAENVAAKSVSSPKLVVQELKKRPGGDAVSKLDGNGRIRIAHVPYAMSLALAKKKVVNETTAAAAAAAKVVEPKTAAQTSKGSRVAHIPQVVPQLVAPEPAQVATQKFPLTVRQYYVNLMHVICVQIYTNGEDAGQRALREELACHDRCKALSVYKNSCMLAAHRLRKEVEQSNLVVVDSSLPSASGIVSHNAVLLAAGKSKGSWSVEKTKKSVMDFRGSALYERLKKWIMTEQQLRDNGFPRTHPDGPKGRAKVYVTNTRNHSILSKVPNERYCCRCNKAYMVDKHGLAVQQQNCIYHWGRKFTSRGESKYGCCQQYGFASGCADAKNHVWEYVDYENLRGYVKTLPKDNPAEEQGVYALDCEMSYTTQGLELTRVTVINEDCNTIYETLVMPENPIIDYNTRFSGITEESMRGVKTTLLDVQATLLTMFSELTILVGHSLESDFKALKLIHDTVVDTSIMFPHKNGPPHKRALRNLCSEYLRKIIQNEVGGHDSAEDAVACMDLIHWKVKEEAKLL